MSIMIPSPEKKYYHMRIIYISGDKTYCYYEINKQKELVESIAIQIEKPVPSIRFEGHRLFPSRITNYRIFVTESPSEMNPHSVRSAYVHGYDFGGDDVTLEITTRGPKPEYHCKQCEAIVNPTDKKCPNGHDLSTVGKKIKLTLTEGLTLSDSVNLSSSFAIEKIDSIVKDLELGPMTPETQKFIDVLDFVSDVINDQTRMIKEEFEKDRAPIPYSREKGIIIFILGIFVGKIIEVLFFG